MLNPTFCVSFLIEPLLNLLWLHTPYIYAGMHIRIWVYTYTNISVHMRVWYIYIYMIYMYTYICIYIDIYICIYMLNPLWMHTVCNPGQALTNAHSHIDFLMARPPQNKPFCSYFADVFWRARKFRSGAPRRRLHLYTFNAHVCAKWCPPLRLVWSWCHSNTACEWFMSHLHVMLHMSESCYVWVSHVAYGGVIWRYCFSCYSAIFNTACEWGNAAIPSVTYECVVLQ